MATVAQTFEPKGFDLFSSNQPTLLLENGTTIPISGYNFTATSQKMFRRWTAVAYLSGNVTVRIRWYSQTGATTGNVRWDAALAAITPGDAQSVLTKALATATNTTTTVNGTARGITTTDVTVSNLDSLAADDEVWLAVSLGANTMTLGAVIASVEVIYASTAGVGAGNVSNAGASTDNAVARFDLATGQVIQNSGVIIDDSNNITGAGTYNTVTVDKWAIVTSTTTTQAISAATTMTAVTNMSIALPRAGTYWIEGMLEVTATAALTSTYAFNVSANLTRMSVMFVNQLTTTTQATGQQNASIASGAAGTTGFASGSRSITTALGVTWSGCIVVSGAATVALLASRSTSTLTVGAASCMNVREQ